MVRAIIAARTTGATAVFRAAVTKIIPPMSNS
jgi:hypothetical protein